MKLLLDQGLPRKAAVILRDAGIDTLHVGEIGFATAEDVEIIEKGRQDNRTIITLDADFHALLALSRATNPSVVRIRIDGLKGEALAHLINQILADWGEELLRGAVLTVQKDRIRMRHLPML
jgi:predicted nuclease of predicted toxin-antitoxin system